jgi:GT2 family glycosyltransferase
MAIQNKSKNLVYAAPIRMQIMNDIRRIRTVGYAVPTLGSRNEYLVNCLKTLSDNNVGFVVVVRPAGESPIDSQLVGLCDAIVDDEGRGLAAAINKGFRSLPKECKYISWIGDDDYLMPNSIINALNSLETGERVTAVFGKCLYVNERGLPLFVNHSGKFAARIIKFGPFLIPQPGSLLRRSAYELAGGLDENLRMVFDLDLFLKLSKLGDLIYVDQTLACYRWHSSTLTSTNRALSFGEGKIVRLRNASLFGRIFISILHPFVITGVFIAKKILLENKVKRLKA